MPIFDGSGNWKIVSGCGRLLPVGRKNLIRDGHRELIRHILYMYADSGNFPVKFSINLRVRFETHTMIGFPWNTPDCKGKNR